MDKINFYTFGDIFHEIAWDYEPDYNPTIEENYVCFNKTTITKDGQVERKGNYYRWDTSNTSIWSKVVN